MGKLGELGEVRKLCVGAGKADAESLEAGRVETLRECGWVEVGGRGGVRGLKERWRTAKGCCGKRRGS